MRGAPEQRRVIRRAGLEAIVGAPAGRAHGQRLGGAGRTAHEPARHAGRDRYGSREWVGAARHRCALCVDRCPTGVIIMGKVGDPTASGDAHQRTNTHGYGYGMRLG